MRPNKTLALLALKANPYSTASGPIVTYRGDGSPLAGLTVDIFPVQEGEGDPSPDNIRPITGWDGMTVEHTGKNLINEDNLTWVTGYYLDSTGSALPSSTYRYTNEYTPVKAGSYYMSYTKTTSLSAGCTVCQYDSNKSFLRRAILTQAAGTTGRKSKSIEFDDDVCYIRFSAPYSATAEHYGSHEFQLELSGSLTDYTPYTGSTLPISWQSEAGTVYGGTLEWLGDDQWKLKKRPEYDSYNGELLVGPWMSSVDVYAPGTTPTIGAQVVDLGGVEAEYTLTIPDSEIVTLSGSNNIWADAGDVSVTYRDPAKVARAKLPLVLRDRVDWPVLLGVMK